MAGRHPHLALTALKVQRTTEPGRYADGGCLYLLVGPDGSKSWLLRTVVKGKRCDIGLGGVALVSLADARDDARELRKTARAGGDPLAMRRHTRTVVPTFKDAATQVHAERELSFKNTKHRKQWLASLGGVFSAFGAKRVDAVTRADVLAALSPTWLARQETSRRVLQRVRLVFEWCKAKGFCAGDNPTQGLTQVLPKHRATKAHHAALHFQQLPTFVQALRASEAGEVVALAFEFTILCAARTAETLQATWAEIDFETKAWTVPASRMKEGVEHRVPLSARCIAILERAQSLADGAGFVFPGRSKGKPLSNMVFLMTLRRMGLGRLATGHGFRSTFKVWASECAHFPDALSEAALSHTLGNKTHAAYNRTDLFDRRRQLMADWEKFATSTPAEVVAITSRRSQ